MELDDGYVLCHEPDCVVCDEVRASMRSHARSSSATPKPIYNGHLDTYIGMGVGGPNDGVLLSSNSLTILLSAYDDDTSEDGWGKKPDRYDYDSDKKQWIYCES